MPFHTDCRKRCIHISCRLIVGSLIEHKLVIRYSHSSARLQRNGHYHALIIDECAIATPEIHDLILETVVTPHNRVLARNVVARQWDGIVRRPTDRGGIIDYSFEWLFPEYIDTKLCGHLFLETVAMMTCHAFVCQRQSRQGNAPARPESPVPEIACIVLRLLRSKWAVGKAVRFRRQDSCTKIS